MRRGADADSSTKKQRVDGGNSPDFLLQNARVNSRADIEWKYAYAEGNLVFKYHISKIGRYSGEFLYVNPYRQGSEMKAEKRFKFYHFLSSAHKLCRMQIDFLNRELCVGWAVEMRDFVARKMSEGVEMNTATKIHISSVVNTYAMTATEDRMLHMNQRWETLAIRTREFLDVTNDYSDLDHMLKRLAVEAMEFMTELGKAPCSGRHPSHYWLQVPLKLRAEEPDPKIKDAVHGMIPRSDPNDVIQKGWVDCVRITMEKFAKMVPPKEISVAEDCAAFERKTGVKIHEQLSDSEKLSIILTHPVIVDVIENDYHCGAGDKPTFRKKGAVVCNNETTQRLVDDAMYPDHHGELRTGKFYEEAYTRGENSKYEDYEKKWKVAYEEAQKVQWLNILRFSDITSDQGLFVVFSVFFLLVFEKQISTMNTLPFNVFQNIISFVERNWHLEESDWGKEYSYNKEITSMVSYVKYEKLYRRLKKYIEIWWKKSKKNILMREPPLQWKRRPLLMKDLDIAAEIESDYLWEQRQADLFHWNIMCAIHHHDEFPNNNIWGQRYD